MCFSSFVDNARGFVCEKSMLLHLIDTGHFLFISWMNVWMDGWTMYALGRQYMPRVPAYHLSDSNDL